MSCPREKEGWSAPRSAINPASRLHSDAPSNTTYGDANPGINETPQLSSKHHPSCHYLWMVPPLRTHIPPRLKTKGLVYLQTVRIGGERPEHVLLLTSVASPKTTRKLKGEERHPAKECSSPTHHTETNNSKNAQSTQQERQYKTLDSVVPPAPREGGRSRRKPRPFRLCQLAPRHYPGTALVVQVQVLVLMQLFSTTTTTTVTRGCSAGPHAVCARVHACDRAVVGAAAHAASAGRDGPEREGVERHQ